LKYNIREINGGIVIEDARDFEPKHVFECGQSFRWDREDDKSYTGVAMGKVANVKKDGDDIFIHNTDIDEFNEIWHVYFDLDRNYGKIKSELSSDSVLEKATKFGNGIRILNQDEWETLISFIISANNRIPMIKRAVSRISERWGKPVRYKDSTYYTFPGIEELAGAGIDELEQCGVGFRAKYIKETALMVQNGDVNLYELKNAGYDKARAELMKLPGVGPKVADCVLLFSMGYSEAFPVDVWVKRIMQQFYLAPDVSLAKIQKYGQSKFGKLAGFAQQYLFYYIRELKGNI
jgi:N-glycosylase/DNA lyase